jgi:hypothetical protein
MVWFGLAGVGWRRNGHVIGQALWYIVTKDLVEEE